MISVKISRVASSIAVVGTLAMSLVEAATPGGRGSCRVKWSCGVVNMNFFALAVSRYERSRDTAKRHCVGGLIKGAMVKSPLRLMTFRDSSITPLQSCHPLTLTVLL